MHKTKQERQQEAIERQQWRNKLTPAVQLAIIRTRPGHSHKEAQRLTRIILRGEA